jgi:hypothetical protein
MQIGILGAGNVGLAVGRQLIGAGHVVKLSSARGPHALTPVAQDIGAEGVSVAEDAAAELVLLAVPWPAVPDVLDPLADWDGRILVDATNPFVSHNPLQLADLQGRSASVVVAEHAPGARVVKAFEMGLDRTGETGEPIPDDLASSDGPTLINDQHAPIDPAASTTAAACTALRPTGWLSTGQSGGRKPARDQ